MKKRVVNVVVASIIIAAVRYSVMDILTFVDDYDLYIENESVL